MGSNAQQVGTAQTMSPEQLNYIQQMLGPMLAQQGQAAYGNLLSGPSEEDFQKSVVDPTMKNYEQQMLPAMQQRFVDANAGSSSALNQALAQSAGDMSNTLAGKRLDYQNSIAQRQLGALGQQGQLVNSKTVDPIVQGPQGGLLKDAITAFMAAYGGSFNGGGGGGGGAKKGAV